LLCPSTPAAWADAALGAPQAAAYSMIRKSGYRFSEKIMLKQDAKAKRRFN
jgi:hypothetical protein